jgi:2-polyprenyl-3-methyl-5-hydroxy-6-metoxy-1,4-benzoquinol methylase
MGTERGENIIFLFFTMEKIEYREYHNQKLNVSQYWDMLDIGNWADIVTQELIKILPSWSSIFEYGAGRWRNAIPLVEKWHYVTAQDIANRAILDLVNTINGRHLTIKTIVWDARDIEHDQMYDVFMIIRMLHFLPVDDVLQIIRNIKSYTRIGGYNVFVIFSNNPTSNNYFPSREIFLDLYKDWKIVFENSEISKTSEWKEMPRFSIILQKLI